MYIDFSSNQNTRSMLVSKEQTERELIRAKRALDNILQQPKNSLNIESRIAQAKINFDFWQDMHSRLSNQLQDCTIQL